jgi:hypothetical protein
MRRRWIVLGAAGVLVVLVGLLGWQLVAGRAESDGTAGGGVANRTAAAPGFASPGLGDASGPAAGNANSAGTAAKEQAPGADTPAVPAPGAPTAVPPLPAQPGAARQVQRDAALAVRVPDVAAASTAVRDIATRFGGYVSDEQRSASTSASVQVRVDSARFDAAVDAVAGLGDLTGKQQHALDLTDQVVDVQARLDAQRASVARVEQIMARATTIGEVVGVESELTTRRAELESLEQRAAALSSQVSLATVSVTLTAASAPPVTPPPPGQAGFLDGLRGGWHGLVVAGRGVLLVIGAVLPFLAVLAVPAAVLLWWLRRRRAAARSVAAELPAGGTG